jgi:hypothetical protein
MTRTIDFKALVPTDFDAPMLNLQIRKAVSLDGGQAFLAAEIGQVHLGKNGRPLQPKRIVSICGHPGESLPKLLRDLADLFEQGKVQTGVPVPGQPGTP